MSLKALTLAPMNVLERNVASRNIPAVWDDEIGTPRVWLVIRKRQGDVMGLPRWKRWLRQNRKAMFITIGFWALWAWIYVEWVAR